MPPTPQDVQQPTSFKEAIRLFKEAIQKVEHAQNAGHEQSVIQSLQDEVDAREAILEQHLDTIADMQVALLQPTSDGDREEVG